jgi:hypothetical protein
MQLVCLGSHTLWLNNKSTDWLTPWIIILLEKLIVAQSGKKFLAFYGTRRFITVFTTAHHKSLSWARCIQSTPFHPIFLRYILILSSHLQLDLPSCFFRYFSFPRSFQCIHSILRRCVIFRTKLDSYGEDVLVPHSTPKLEDDPLSAVRDFLFDIFSAKLKVKLSLC